MFINFSKIFFPLKITSLLFCGVTGFDDCLFSFFKIVLVFLLLYVKIGFKRLPGSRSV